MGADDVLKYGFAVLGGRKAVRLGSRLASLVRNGPSRTIVVESITFDEVMTSVDMLEVKSSPLPSPTVEPRPGASPLTIAATAVVAYAIATVVHEAVGHGGACLITGCIPRLVTSMQFVGDETGLSANAVRFGAAGGRFANLIFAAITISALRRRRDAQGAGCRRRLRRRSCLRPQSDSCG